MALETHQGPANRPDDIEQTEVLSPMLRDDDLHDDDLLGYALGESDPASVAGIEAHLACCLYCRVRLNRIKISDPRLEPPAFAVSAPPVSEEALKCLVADPPDHVEAGQVWFARGDHEQLMVWISHLLPNFDAVMAHPVTLNIHAVDDRALILELPGIGSVAVVSSLFGKVPKSKLVAHLGDLDIASDFRRIADAKRAGTQSNLRTGRPITGPADERIEFSRFLTDQLADLDPIIEPEDELLAIS